MEVGAAGVTAKGAASREAACATGAGGVEAGVAERMVPFVKRKTMQKISVFSI